MAAKAGVIADATRGVSPTPATDMIIAMSDREHVRADTAT
jgi:hypothetical protein